MFNEKDVLNRVEEVLGVFAEEFPGKTPGQIANFVARSELTECDRILSYIDERVQGEGPTHVLEDALRDIRNGKHRK